MCDPIKNESSWKTKHDIWSEEFQECETVKSKCSNWSYWPISTRRCRSLQQGRHKENQARSIIVKQWRWVRKGEKERHAWSRTCCFQMLTEDQPLGRTMAGRKDQKQLGMELNSFSLVVEPHLALLTQATIIKLRSVGPQNGQRHDNMGGRLLGRRGLAEWLRVMGVKMTKVYMCIWNCQIHENT